MILEQLAGSRANYWIGLALDLVVSVTGLVAGFVLAPLPTALAAFLAGLVVYSLYEYGLHRWVYHGNGRIARLHATHHREPDVLIGAPVYFSLGFALVHGLLAGAVFGAPAGLVFACAMLHGYAQQSAIHHLAHGWPHSGRRAIRSPLRKHHLVHHHDGARNFGISTRLWDQLFCTAHTAGDRRTAPHRTFLTSPWRADCTSRTPCPPLTSKPNGNS